MNAPALSPDRILQARLPENSSVKIIGLGGVGSLVARYGAVFLASLGGESRLVLIDGDAFEPSNASRMFFAAHGNKAAVLRDELLSHLSYSSLALLAIEEYVTPENVHQIIHDG